MEGGLEKFRPQQSKPLEIDLEKDEHGVWKLPGDVEHPQVLSEEAYARIELKKRAAEAVEAFAESPTGKTTLAWALQRLPAIDSNIRVLKTWRSFERNGEKRRDQALHEMKIDIQTIQRYRGEFRAPAQLLIDRDPTINGAIEVTIDEIFRAHGIPDEAILRVAMHEALVEK